MFSYSKLLKDLVGTNGKNGLKIIVPSPRKALNCDTQKFAFMYLLERMIQPKGLQLGLKLFWVGIDL